MAKESYVVVHNIAKRHNVGTLARSATAFGVSEIILVGRRDFNSFGSHGSSSHLKFRHFYSLLDAKRFLKVLRAPLKSISFLKAHSSFKLKYLIKIADYQEEKNCDICGVEITENAIPIGDHPFQKSTAFLLGNEGTGLSAKECEICDFFVYIPQYGSGTASLNVTVAASIVLHHFGAWAGFVEQNRDGGKYVVAEKPQKQGKYSEETQERIIEERKYKKETASKGFFDDGKNVDLNSFFVDE